MRTSEATILSGTNASPYIMLFGHRPHGKLPVLGHKYHDIDRAPLVEQRERLRMRRNTVKCLDKHAKNCQSSVLVLKSTSYKLRASLTAAGGLATGW